MAFTMHSHSGQFCPGHAKDQLEVIIQHAISIGYKTMALTEHMPRLSVEDLYPEELDDPATSLAVLAPRHEEYLVHAELLRAKYANHIHILVAFEGEWYREEYGPFIAGLAQHPSIDFFIGSVHHAVGGIPIDYDLATYQKAVTEVGAGSEEKLYESYYDEQFAMLQALKPRVIGHFDLVRLMSTEPGRDVSQWEGVWSRICRNLEFVVSYGGWLECNTSALRKGLAEPYPCRIISEKYLALGGKFTFSDDSHGIAQVATNYARGLAYLESLGITDVWTFKRTPPTIVGSTKGNLEEVAVPLQVFRATLTDA